MPWAATRRPRGARWALPRIAAPALLVAAGAILLVLALPLGRPDNGDFARYSAPWFEGPLGQAPGLPQSREEWLARWKDRAWHRYWVLREGPVLSPFLGVDTARWTWAPGLVAQRLLVGDRIFDLTWAGLGPRLLVLLAIAAVGTALARAAGRGESVATALLAGAPWVLLLTASWATSYFNSFYRESGSFAYGALLLAAVAVEPLLPLGAWLLGFVGLGAIFVASAPAHGPTAVAIAVAAFLALRSRRQERTPGGVLWIAGAIAVLAVAGFASVAANDAALSRKNAFNALFLGLLPLSSQPQRHLERLGLPTGAASLIGQSAFEPQAAKALETLPELRHGQLPRMIYDEPGLLPRALEKAATLLNVTGIEDLSLLAHDAPHPRRRPATNLWGEFQRRWLPRGWAFWCWIAVAVCGGLFAQRATGAEVRVFGRVLVFAGTASAVEVVVKFFGDGTIGALRHLVAANLFLGATVAAATSLAVLQAFRRGVDGVDGGAPTA